jgi:glycosyltransferase involved in cell wall biosynthesis
MKRLLAISWEMPPLSGPRAMQVSRTLRHLVPLGWASTVICFGPRSDRYNQDFVTNLEPGAIEVIRVASPEEWLVFRGLWRLVPPLKQLPDEKWVWIRRAAAAARTHMRRHAFSAIVSFAQPWSDHLIARRLHRESSIPWIAHFSDPWVDSPYARGYGWQRRVWARMERSVAAEADRLVFQNRQTAVHTMDKYPGSWADKVSVIPQGFEARVETPLPRATTGRPGDPLRVVYTGRFYPGKRTPDGVLDAIARLHARTPLSGRLRVDVFGVPFRSYASRAAALGLAEVVRFHGRVSPAKALEAAQNADVLLVIDAPSLGPNLFLPSKLIDYLPLEKPIVGVTPLEGASAELLRPLGGPIVDPEDIEGIARAFSALLEQAEQGSLRVGPSYRELVRGYDIRETTRQFAGVLNSLVPAAGAA